MSREVEFEQKIEILNQHLAAVATVLETLILRLNYDGNSPAASLLSDIDALQSQTVSGDKRQLLSQFVRALKDADSWQPPVRSA